MKGKMHTAIITSNGGMKLSYRTREEALTDRDYDSVLYDWAEQICRLLGIEIPIIAETPQTYIQQLDPRTGLFTSLYAITFWKEENPELTKNLVFISFMDNPILAAGVLAHELRHIWQKKNGTYAMTAVGYVDSLYNENEIDADAFAISLLVVIFLKTCEEIADIVCKNEKRKFSESYNVRVDRAKEMLVENADSYDELSVEDKYKLRLALVTHKYIFASNERIIIPIRSSIFGRYTIMTEGSMRDLIKEDFSVWEPSASLLWKNQSFSTDPFHVLQTYAKTNGGDISGIFVKLYHENKPYEMERDDCGRKWIDYSVQLKSSKEVFDSECSFGIWAARANTLKNIKGAGYLNRYGWNLMILETMSEEKYVFTDLEIVGDRFSVIGYGKLSDDRTWKQLKDHLNEDEYNEIACSINLCQIPGIVAPIAKTDENKDKRKKIIDKIIKRSAKNKQH